jgi:hypothetical protein
MSARASLLFFSLLLAGIATASAQERPIALSPEELQGVKLCADAEAATQIDVCKSYLADHPRGPGAEMVLEVLLTAYDLAHDEDHVLSTADELLSRNHENLRALAFEVALHLRFANKVMSDKTAMQQELDTAVGYARTGLSASQPGWLSDGEWAALKDETEPLFRAALERWKQNQTAS